MTLDDITQAVYTITGRPDRVGETLIAIQGATLKAHQSDYYWKDILEISIVFDTATYIQNLDYRALVPRWRAIKYLRQFDPNSIPPGAPLCELDIIPPENIFDQYKIQKTNVYYTAGAYVQINSATAWQYYLLGCYVNPDITTAGYNSWIALDHPFAIIYDAAATVFKAIGKDEEAAAYRQIVADQYAELKASNILGEGF